MPWIKKGTCQFCGKRLRLKKYNFLPTHKHDGIICLGSNQAGKDHKLEFKKVMK